MAQSLGQAQEDDRRVKAHTKRAHEELESALSIVRRSVRMNPKARSMELELARVLHGLDNLGTLVSRIPIEEPSTRGPLSAEAHRARRALMESKKVKDLVNGQDLVEKDDE